MSLVTFEFGLEFLTPAFVGGADPTRKADFTLKPLKSAMRYWWRQFQDMRDGPALFDKESRIFGSTQRASPISLRLISKDGIRCSKGHYQPSGSGLSYLFYSLRGCNSWIEAKSCLSFALTLRSETTEDIHEVLLSLWLASTFGGLGSRSRRGAGSFDLRQTSAPPSWEKEVEDLFSKQATDLYKTLQNGPPEAGFFSRVNISSPIATAMQKPGYFKVHDPNPAKDADAILDHIGSAMKDHRQCFTYNTGSSAHKHRAAKALHLAGIKGAYSAGPRAFDKTAFGLPMVCVFKQRGPSGNLLRHQSGPKQGKIKFEPWRIILEPSEHERRASPLIISVSRKPGTSKECTANLLILWGAFLSNKEKIDIVKTQSVGNHTVRTNLGQVSVPGPNALTNFLGSL